MVASVTITNLPRSVGAVSSRKRSAEEIKWIGH
jgi:hypothetical protein